MKYFGSLKNLLSFNFVLVSVVPVLIVGILSLYTLTSSLEKEISTKNFLLAKSLSRELDQFLDNSASNLQQIVLAIEQNTIQADKLNTYLDDQIDHFKVFDMIRVLDREGIVVHLSPYDANISNIDMSAHEYFKNSRKKNGPYWSRVFMSSQTYIPTITLVQSFSDGVVVGHLNLSRLSALVNKVKFGTSGYAAITDNDGTIIAHRHRKYVDEQWNFKNNKIVKQGLSGNEGTYRYTFAGENKIGSVAIVDHTRWVVGVVQPVDEAFATIRQIQIFVWLGCFGAVLLAVVISLVSLKKAFNPLSRLAEGTEQIKHGNYKYELQLPSFIEIDRLANSFKAMTDAVEKREYKLKHAHDSLERKVEERTLELSRAKKDAEANEKWLRAVFESMGEGLIAHRIMKDGTPGPFEIVNPVWRDNLGYSEQELSKLSPTEIGDPKIAMQPTPAVMENINTRGFAKFETIQVRKDGSKIPVAVHTRVFTFQEQKWVLSVLSDITERNKAALEREKLIKKLEKMLAEIKTLQGILPLCSFCKKIRDDKGFWEQVDVYIHKYSDADISHGICPDCMKEHYTEFYEEI